MSRFFGNILIALQTSISPTTLSAVANTTTSPISASVSGGRGVYTYLWIQSGTTCTITSLTGASTTFTGSGVAGTTTVYCQPTDTITGNMLETNSCTITWTAVPITQNVVISGSGTYNGSSQAYILTGTPASPAPSGSPASFIDAGTYTSANITVTAGSGYTLGTVTGSFVINRATISGTAANTTVTYNGVLRTVIVITGVTPAGATFTGSLTASGTDAGSYSSSITGTGNYQGTVSGGTLTINRATISGTAENTTVTYNGALRSATVITGVTPAGATFTGSVTASGTNAGSYSSSITGTGNYQGTVSGGTLTINRATITGMTFTLNGTSFTTAQNRNLPGTFTIATGTPTPSGATYSPTTVSRSTAGSFSLTTSGTGNYTGSRTSATVTLWSGVVNEINRITAWQVQLRATLSPTSATAYSWSRTGGTWTGSVSFSSTTAQTVTVTVPTSAGTRNSIIRCIMSYSGGSYTDTITVPWGLL
jgi:hypothetical protein